MTEQQQPSFTEGENKDDYVVISSDGHCGAETLEYRAYLAAEWHDEFDRWVVEYESPFKDSVDHTAKRNWDSDFRLSEQDADGITAEVLFPNTIPPFFETVGILGIGLPKTEHSLNRRWAGLQAHNRWSVDYCNKEPLRRRAVIQIFPHDIDKAVKEIEWASEQEVLGGVLLPAIPPNHAIDPYFHTRYEPIWRVCEERDFPICHHSGSGIPEMPFSEPGGFSVMEVESMFWTRRTLTHLVLGGVFERFPKLKYAQTEMGGISWVIDLGNAMDYSVKEQKGKNRTRTMFADDTIRKMSLKPSEYIRRNVYHGASVWAAHEVPSRYEIGVDRIMWGTDYPHESCSTPQSSEAIRWALAELPDEEVRMILAGTAAQLYKFDLEALAKLGIGKKYEEVHTPLYGPELTDAQRRLNTSGTGDRSIRPFEGGVLLARAAV